MYLCWSKRVGWHDIGTLGESVQVEVGIKDFWCEYTVKSIQPFLFCKMEVKTAVLEKKNSVYLACKLYIEVTLSVYHICSYPCMLMTLQFKFY